MCIATPVRVIAAHGRSARCVDSDGREDDVDTTLVQATKPGDWLLVFHGAAREVIDAGRAYAIDRALRALAQVLRGDTSGIDAAFADLVGRTPTLPPTIAAPPRAPTDRPESRGRIK
jgi:hydrogenase expression/formation protein HypC